MAVFTGIFTELPIDSKLIIPEQKPDVECLIDYSITVNIDKGEVIDTPLLVPEDPTLFLKKVIVTGSVRIIIKYSALEATQRVHGAHFNIPFCTLIEWPDGPAQGTPITIQPVIEKASLILENPRTIDKIILLRLDVYR